MSTQFTMCCTWRCGWGYRKPSSFVSKTCDGITIGCLYTLPWVAHTNILVTWIVFTWIRSDKLRKLTPQVLGRYEGKQIVYSTFHMTCTCTETAYARTMCNYICSQNNVRAVHPQRQCNNYDVKNSLLMWLCAKKLCTFIRIFNWTVYVHVHVCMAWLNYHVSSSLDQWSWWVPEQRLPPARVLASTSWQLDSVAGTTGGDSVVLWGGGWWVVTKGVWGGRWRNYTWQ